jgi:hypothetical protein
MQLPHDHDHFGERVLESQEEYHKLLIYTCNRYHLGYKSSTAGGDFVLVLQNGRDRVVVAFTTTYVISAYKVVRCTR